MVVYLEDSAERSDLWLVMLWFVSVVLIGGGLCMNLAPAVLKACFDTTAKDSTDAELLVRSGSLMAECTENDNETDAELNSKCVESQIHKLPADIADGRVPSVKVGTGTDVAVVPAFQAKAVGGKTPNEVKAFRVDDDVVQSSRIFDESDTIVPKAKASTEGPIVHQEGVSEARAHELPPLLIRSLSTLETAVHVAEAAVAELNKIDPTEADTELNVVYEQELADVEMLSHNADQPEATIDEAEAAVANLNKIDPTEADAELKNVCSENKPGSVTSCKCEGESRMKVTKESNAADGQISETTADRDGEATVSLHFPTALPHASNHRCVLCI